MLMRSYCFRIAALTLMTCLILAVPPVAGSAAAAATTPQLNAFLFKTMLDDTRSLFEKRREQMITLGSIQA